MGKFTNAWIIDDDGTYVYGVKRLMQMVDFCDVCSVYSNGLEAYESLKEKVSKPEELPGIIFLDLNMPVWDGWIFLQHFENLNLDQPIQLYVMSSSPQENDRESALGNKYVSGFYVKPITVVELKEIMAGL